MLKRVQHDGVQLAMGHPELVSGSMNILEITSLIATWYKSPEGGLKRLQRCVFSEVPLRGI